MARFELELENATLFGRERGAGSPVVFLHAGVCDHRMWAHQLDDISDDFHAIAYDRRGFGQSDSQDVQYDDVDDLAALLDHFEAQRAVLVGCSMGGGLAIDFALRHPSRVSGLFLVASSMRGAPIPNATMLEDQIDAEYEKVELAGDDAALNQFEADVWLEGIGQPRGRTGAKARELFLDMNAKHIAHPRAGKHVEREPYFERLGEVAVPTLLLSGDYDFSYHRIVNAKAQEKISGSVVERFDDSAHLPSMDNPQRFNDLLSDFLAQF